MNPFAFQCPTRVNYGEGIASMAVDLIEEFGGKRTLLVTDAVIRKMGLIDPVLQAFADSGLANPAIFSDVPPDSDLDCLKRCLKVAQENYCDCIVAIGGGSVIDTAKVANICISLGGDLMDHQGLNALDRRLKPLVVVPTTAGTGSEVSFVAMVKDGKAGKKILFASRYLAPDAALLDPTLLVTLPPKLTAATGMDAICHDIESFTVLMSNSQITDALAMESLRLMFEYLPRATADGSDMDARSNTLIASTMAGIAFTNAGVGIVHALSHSTGARYGTHHGITNSVFLPHGMRFNVDTVASRYAILARHLGLTSSHSDETAAKTLIDSVEKLAHHIGLPAKLRNIGVPALSKKDLDDLTELALTDTALMFNPKEASGEDLVKLYEGAY